ncbi:cohesin subunit SA-3-like [Melospiza melodia melodia]|uniref:cohesin subunit SA-3-like n=1 Tax=Melospiza melodia melodia TaxID=1914991 RepID=UPI002FD684F4
MAPRRSPRLRASGSSSGSSSGPAPGSAPRGSGSPSSPHSPEFPDDSDSGSDFEASLRPRSKRGPPRAAPRNRAPKRSRLSRGAGRDPEPNSPEQNSLFEAVFSGKVATETLVDEWLEWYPAGQGGRVPGAAQLHRALLRLQGRGDPRDVPELQNSEIIRRLTETFQEDSPEYPLSMSTPEWRRFRDSPDYPLSMSTPEWRRFRVGFSELLAVLVLRGQHRELQDGFLMDSLLSFLTGLADSQVRPFRHTGTLAALKLMSSLVEVALGVGQAAGELSAPVWGRKGKRARPEGQRAPRGTQGQTAAGGAEMG